MRIFMTDATGYVGAGIAGALAKKGHQISALVHSEEDSDRLRQAQAKPIPGILSEPEDWIEQALVHDAILHSATAFHEDIGENDHLFIHALLEKSQDLPSEEKIPFIYTGGCWLYPEAPVIPITERHVIDPLPAFEWMVDSIEQISRAPAFLLTIIHPAHIVCSGHGIIADYAKQLRESGMITYIQSKEIHLPLIQADDLANLYARTIEHRADGLLLNATAIKSTTLDALGAEIARQCDLPYQYQTIDLEEAEAAFGPRVACIAHSQRMEAGRARDLLGWDPEFDTIEALVSNSLEDNDLSSDISA